MSNTGRKMFLRECRPLEYSVILWNLNSNWYCNWLCRIGYLHGTTEVFQSLNSNFEYCSKLVRRAALYHIFGSLQVLHPLGFKCSPDSPFGIFIPPPMYIRFIRTSHPWILIHSAFQLLASVTGSLSVYGVISLIRLLYLLYSEYTSPLHDVPGPPSPSWWFGNFKEAQATVSNAPRHYCYT